MWVAASQREGCIKTFNLERWIASTSATLREAVIYVLAEFVR